MRFNWIQRRKTHLRRPAYVSQTDDLTRKSSWRGGAWPSSARTVGHSLKCDNERDPRPYLLIHLSDGCTIGRPLSLRKRKEGSTVGQYAPNP